MKADCPAFRAVVEELDHRAPGIPLLALGQTVFWDEPMKAGVFAAFEECGSPRKFVAGVHDTDYFAKFHGPGQGYAALPHNDTTTRDLWSAAGEFSALFGSETVVTKEQLARSGAKVHLLEKERPGFLDEITEAYGWRGVAQLAKESRIAAEKQIGPIFPHIFSAFEWALEESLRLVSGRHRTDSDQMREQLLQLVCDIRNEMATDATLAEFYERLIPELHQLVLGRALPLETTRTTQLLRFNRATAHLGRFEIVDRFLRPESRDQARDAYNQAVARSEIYTLDRFGAGALPFDLYIPGIGRGTLRLGKRGGLVMAERPVGFSLRKPVESVQELAEVLEAKFGPDCVLVGKAITLIPMLAREFVFVFHEGASSYVWRSRQMADHLASSGFPIKLYPILRVTLNPWDAMSECCAWVHLPEEMRRPFGSHELSAPTFALRWREVARAQKERLRELSLVRRPHALLSYLQSELGGQWDCLMDEYKSIQQQFLELGESIAEIKERKRKLRESIAANAAKRDALQAKKGRHFRAHIFEKSPTVRAQQERTQLESTIAQLDHERTGLRAEYRKLEVEQKETIQSDKIRRIREHRYNIALEAEIMRAQLIREAVVCSAGLEQAGHRPSAWWFPLICPGGSWFRQTMLETTCRLEPLCSC